MRVDKFYLDSWCKPAVDDRRGKSALVESISQLLNPKIGDITDNPKSVGMQNGYTINDLRRTNNPAHRTLGYGM